MHVFYRRVLLNICKVRKQFWVLQLQDTYTVCLASIQQPGPNCAFCLRYYLLCSRKTKVLPTAPNRTYTSISYCIKTRVDLSSYSHRGLPFGTPWWISSLKLVMKITNRMINVITISRFTFIVMCILHFLEAKSMSFFRKKPGLKRIAKLSNITLATFFTSYCLIYWGLSIASLRCPDICPSVVLTHCQTSAQTLLTAFSCPAFS
jgi:hypothetical protein